VLRGHIPEAVTELNLQPVGRLPSTNRLHVAIGLPLRNQDALGALIKQIYDPASPQYHQYLTPEQFTEKFGPTKDDYAAVMDFATANRLAVTTTFRNRALLDVEGTVADVEKVLHLTMRLYRHPTEARMFYAPDTEPSLDLAVSVLHVGGLDNYSIPCPNFRRKQPGAVPNITPNAGSGPGGSYMGNDFRAAYVPGVQLTGAGQAVGLLEFDGYYTNDITYYEATNGLPNVTLTNVLIDGATGSPSGYGGEVEDSLDIEMVISMAPGVSEVVLYMAPNPSPWEDLMCQMANDNLAKQISCSWSSGGPDPTAEQALVQMAAQGQSFFTASGDDDAYGVAGYTGSIPFPSDSTNITSVGGTTLSTTGPGGSYVSETVWNEGCSDYYRGGIGSGGGISTNYSIPPWQQGVSMALNQGSTTMRNIPDVALTAGNIYVRVDGGDEDLSGTSFAAPLWAGLTALVNEQGALNGRNPVGFLNPALYAIGEGINYTACFHDITTGSNGWYCSADLVSTNFLSVTGYDLCTGWGTPTGSNLINALVGNCGPYSITTSNSPGGGGSTSGGGTVACGSNVTVCSMANACYSFVNWTDQNSNVVSTSACYTFTAATNVTLVANFTPIISCTITTSNSPGGGGSASGGGTGACGSNVRVCATPDAGYSFLNWTLSGNVVTNSACYTFESPSNETLVANFTPCSVSTSSSPANGGATSGGGPYACGSQVTVCATTNSCYRFVNWTDQNSNVVSASACCSLTVTGNETLVANFALITYTVSTSSSPPADGFASGGGTYTCGSNVTVCATTNACSSFLNWTVNSNVVSTSACYTFTVVTSVTLVANFALSSGNYTSLYSFGSFPYGEYDGQNPRAGLVQGSDDNFYGTASYGGANVSNGCNCGTVFRISPSGNYTSLYSFGSSPHGEYDGQNPQAGLVQGSDGNFYGTTFDGGPYLDGNIFRISPSGNYTSLYWFGSSPNDGSNPWAGLVQGRDGNFYGTASDGGVSNNGTVFRISPSGSYTSLYWFGSSPNDGSNPWAGLVQGRDSSFYGTASGGGASNNGTVFRISPSGNYTSLYSFGSQPNDGFEPEAGLVQGSDGNFYGTTFDGGRYGNGTVFRITASGSLTSLWSFTGGCDGGNPRAGLVQGSDGNFYGTASLGGLGGGTVFRITASGSLTTLYYFGSSGFVQGSDGNFYGTTASGGTNYDGSVFKLTLPLSPPPNQISGVQLAGTNAVITIPSIAGETYQLQYRSSMTTGSWSNVPGVSITNSIGSLLTLTNFAGANQPQGFYRFAITP